MSTITFDTLKYARQLETAGFSAVQAGAFVNAQRDILSEAFEPSLATSSDRLLLKSDFALMGAKFETKFDKLSLMMGILIALEAANFAKQYF